MLKIMRMTQWWSLAALVLVAMVSTASAADTWVTVSTDGNAVMEVTAVAEAPQVSVLRADPGGVSARITSTGFGVEAKSVDAGEFLALNWPGAALTGNIGGPAMPVVRRMFVAPAGAEVSLRVLESPGVVFDLDEAQLPWRVMPVQPPVEKVPGALEQAVFQIDQSAYSGTSHFSSERASVQELGIVRGQRLFMLEIRPVAYDTSSRTLTFYPDLRTQVLFKGGTFEHSPMSTMPGLAEQVINPEQITTNSDKGDGNYLIIVDSAYETDIAAFAAAKAGQGFSVSTHVVDGDSNTAIKSYIQGLWGTANAPDYILLVGDTDTIPHWVGGGVGTPATDLQYGCMDGATDWYPDIAIGRFPVRSSAQLSAIVDKTLYYEAAVFSDPGYKMRSVFMASTDNYTVSEGTHNWVINNYMDPLGYTSDKLYTVTYGATTQDVRDSFNAGRFFGVYSGHGASTYWADGPPFYQTDVNNLTNADMYPVVFSFACVTGTYTLTECFTETWIRAEDKGAVGIYGSSVNSYWTEDDVLEKRLFDSIFDESDSVPPRLGPVWNDTLMRYLAQMGATSTTRRYFEMYNLMGDPSLLYLGTEAPPTGLRVSPFSGLAAEGQAGGPFTPDSIVYTLENLNDTSLDYSINNSQPWVSVSDAGGSLAGLATTDVTVSINSNANSLAVGTYSDSVNFINETDHDGDTSRSVDLTVGVPTMQYSWTMDFDPGWTTEGQWAWGVPTGGGGSSGGPDPTSGYTGSNVYGYNLDGDYPNGMSVQYLTTTPINCAGLAQTSVKFQRWLGVESSSYDHAELHVSNDGSSWTQLYANSGSFSDSSWMAQEYDISAVADNQPTVYLRWSMGPTDGSVTYCGWNIDDVEIWGLGEVGPQCYTNEDCDDGHYCNGDETCVDDLCQAGTAVDCDDGVDCTDDSCNEILDDCDNIANDGYCADALFCNGDESCDVDLGCQPGTDPCDGGACDENNDVCLGCDYDGTCEVGEDCTTCPSDCIGGSGGGFCGDGVCQPALGEDCRSCDSDCNGKQTGAPSGRFCCGDGDGVNPVGCDDSRCTDGAWECTDAAQDPYCCGDGSCDSPEDYGSCSLDCPPPVCGDGNCDPGETYCDCPSDCPAVLTETDCSDGIDNDCDGYIDMADRDCSCLPRGADCAANADCCSVRCHRGTCK
jgi:hypothetical protein